MATNFLSALDLDRRIAHLDRMIARWHAQMDEADADRQEQERADAEHLAQLDREADALADAIEAGDCAADGEPIGYDRYHGGV
jgi:uncharacterized small protein (DUF1192 family)